MMQQYIMSQETGEALAGQLHFHISFTDLLMRHYFLGFGWSYYTCHNCRGVSNFTLVYCSLEVSHFLLSEEIHVKTNYWNSSSSRNGPVTAIMDSSYVVSFHEVLWIRIASVGINWHFRTTYFHFHQYWFARRNFDFTILGSDCQFKNDNGVMDSARCYCYWFGSTLMIIGYLSVIASALVGIQPGISWGQQWWEWYYPLNNSRCNTHR